ncbi:acylneuraminate cytidylyltransferase family protein [Clostridium sp. HBUAS56017]|uniref:acylneuraminate cytidylyltransferase family protein n=1 Tax=Clostridium sp. HBUAS56017 TaxID=2571128 RepID=UPI0011784370|nr:acylneuraminate cytidylyltransferase family protein [Clostridium sp. HBUAS56017]
MKSKILAIIPARSGSKGLRNKNIKLLNGKPLMAYTIEAAKKSNIFDKIVVSTDSEEYADIAKSYGASIPFIRPQFLSGDEVSTEDVIVNLLSYYESIGEKFQYFMLLQPTSPLRSSKDILKSLELLMEKSADAVISVCQCDYSPLLMTKLDGDTRLDGFLKGIKKVRRQDLELYYRINGAIYLCNVKYYLRYRDFYKQNCFAYKMDKYNSIDIDDIYQFKLAELLLKDIN